MCLQVNKIWLPGGDGPRLGLPGVLGSHPLLGHGLEKVLPKAQMTCSGTDTEVRRDVWRQMQDEAGEWLVCAVLLLTIAASPQTAGQTPPNQLTPAGAPALPGGCRLLHQHQLSRHVPARPQADLIISFGSLSILALSLRCLLVGDPRTLCPARPHSRGEQRATDL